METEHRTMAKGNGYPTDLVFAPLTSNRDASSRKPESAEVWDGPL